VIRIVSDFYIQARRALSSSTKKILYLDIFLYRKRAKNSLTFERKKKYFTEEKGVLI
jgi:hypothetical protein